MIEGTVSMFTQSVPATISHKFVIKLRIYLDAKILL
jgi:hypothetical protein